MTLDELAALVGDMRVMLGRMDGKLDVLVTGHDDHEGRLRALETRVPADLPKQLADASRFRWVLLGAAAAAGAAGGRLMTVLGF